MHSLTFYFSLTLALLSSCVNKTTEQSKNPNQKNSLPSWNNTPNKKAVLQFIEESADKSHPNFIPVTDRIAVFDNDGTLWAEQPLYFQLLFTLDRIHQMAPNHPEWETTEPFKSVLANDTNALLAQGKHALIELIYHTHADMTSNEFNASVKQWVSTATHPTTGKLYTQMVYQPMLELLDELRENQFTVFIVSGGGVDFMRVWAEEVYHIPPHQIIGSRVSATYENKQIIKQPTLNHLNDKEGKPVGIHQHIGKLPVFCGGNSDGDLAMMQYTASASPSFMLYIHHTDAEREWAYDSLSHIGKLQNGLKIANQKQWTVVDMKEDWNAIFPN